MILNKIAILAAAWLIARNVSDHDAYFVSYQSMVAKTKVIWQRK